VPAPVGQLVQRRGVVPLAAAELPHRRQLDAVVTGPVVGPIPAMLDHRTGGSDKALGALQPHRQARQLRPLRRRVALHLGGIEDVAGLGLRLREQLALGP
jgi:hypothetical protein